jgi:hypothetical protein
VYIHHILFVFVGCAEGRTIGARFIGKDFDGTGPGLLKSFPFIVA